MPALSKETIQELEDAANRMRIHGVTSTNASQSGHPTSCASAADIVSVLFFHTMKYKVAEPRDPSSDRFVLSKGHAAPLLYAAWAEAGLFPVAELNNLRKIDSDLEGHPTPKLNFVDVATGSLGQGLSCAAGMALVGKYVDKASYRVYCLMGDGESAEGSVWEAMAFAAHHQLDNLVAIFDVNRLGQSEPTALQHKLEVYKQRAESFGWNTYVVDGHNVKALVEAFDNGAQVKGKPTCIIAQTYKGKGFPGIEDELNWHGKPLGDKTDEVLAAVNGRIQNKGAAKIHPQNPNNDAGTADISNIVLSEPPNYQLGQAVATRLAYGTALVKLGKSNARVIAMDGDTKNSTFSEKFKNAFPDRYFEAYIAEQNLVGVAVGAGTRGRTVPFVSTFAAFFTRAFDQLRMGAVSQANIKCAGSHAGCSIGEDGPSQMALEDIAMFRSIPNCTVFYPCDAVETERSCELAANIKGICFIRTSRPNTAVLYSNEEVFEIGKAKIVRQSANDKVLVIGAGITVHEALKAADELAKKGLNIRVMDPFTIKPIDAVAIINHARQTGGRIVTVEDHYAEGGLGEAVAGAVALQRDIIVKILAVPRIPRSGPPNVLIDMFGIGSRSIIEAVESIINA